MGTPLPTGASFNAPTTSQGTFKNSMQQLLNYLAGLLGTDGNITTLRAMLGIAAQNYNPRGVWSASASYAANDYVSNPGDGFAYVCSSPVGPSATPPNSDTSHWFLAQGASAALLASNSGLASIGSATGVNAESRLTADEGKITSNTAAILLRALDSVVMHLSGTETITGPKTFTAETQLTFAPVNPNDIARLADILAIATGLIPKAAVDAATTAALPANTYLNGTLGVGATLTGTSNGALPAQDGVTLTVGKRLWVLHEATPANNGIYVFTQVGDGSNPYILTRAADYDVASDIAGGFAGVSGGSTLIGNQYGITLAAGGITVGTTALVPILIPAAGITAALAPIHAALDPIAAIYQFPALVRDYVRAFIDERGRILMATLSNGAVEIPKLYDGNRTDIYAKLTTAYNAALALPAPSSYKTNLIAALKYGFFPDVMASPPTMSFAVTTPTITGGSTLPWNSSLWRTLYGSYVNNPGVAFGKWLSANYTTISNGPPTQSTNGAVEFVHHGTALELQVLGNGGSLAVFVGPDASTPATLARANTTNLIIPNSVGAFCYLKLDFGAVNATRRIRLEGRAMSFGGVNLKAGETVTAVTDPKPPIVGIIGDSFIESAIGTVLAGAGMTYVMARALGWDVWSSGVPGSGVINIPAGLTNYQNRMADMYGISGIQAMILWNSVNDSGQPPATLYAGLRNCMNQFRAIQPNVPIIISGQYSLSGIPAVGWYALRDAAAQVAREYSATSFIDQLLPNIMTGTGSIAYPVPSSLAVSSSGTTGGPAAGTYYYVVTTNDASGETPRSAEVSITSTGGPIVLTWAYPGSTSATNKVYRGTTPGGENVRIASGIVSSAQTFTDTGGAGTSASPPSTNTSGVVGDGNCDIERNFDLVHPSPDGHNYRGLEFNTRVRNAVQQMQ